MMALRQYKKSADILTKIFLGIVLAAIAVTVLFPLYYVLATSLKAYGEYVLNPLGLNFSKLIFKNYAEVLGSKNLLGATLNSITVTVTGVVLTVVFSALAAFAIGVVQFRGSGFLYFIAISTMFFTGEMTYVPMYLLYNKLKLLNTYGVLLLPYLVGIPGLGIVLGANFIRKIPKEIHEAAFLEGAKLRNVFVSIDLRLLLPILSVVAIMTFQSVWSDFFWPMISVMGNRKLHTLPLMMIGFKAADASMYGQYCAGLTIMTLPIVVVYCFFSKYFLQGMSAGAVKG
ncbi:MAG: carbohydrate ABC transporter permease [Clostridiales bacterium]|jgi:ABC-type glycerol-3-phosphate transport system permease component|nr:carbohydrate ABC transporter permease [Clostridiales bacterium]